MDNECLIINCKDTQTAYKYIYSEDNILEIRGIILPKYEQLIYVKEQDLFIGYHGTKIALSDNDGHLLDQDTCFCNDKESCIVLRNLEDTISYTTSETKLKLVFKISHTKISNLRSCEFEVPTDSRIQDYQLLPEERILILGRKGRLVLTDFQGEVLKTVKIDLGRTFQANTLTISQDCKFAIVSLH